MLLTSRVKTSIRDLIRQAHVRPMIIILSNRCPAVLVLFRMAKPNQGCSRVMLCSNFKDKDLCIVWRRSAPAANTDVLRLKLHYKNLDSFYVKIESIYESQRVERDPNMSVGDYIYSHRINVQ